MKKIFFVGLTLFLWSQTGVCQTQVKGYVYSDLNKNGKKDNGEKGIATVAVTNGLEVVLTDKNGFYELPIGNDNIISVIKPSAYRVSSNSDNLPQFFYNHKPQGSPQLKYQGVAPTGKLPNNVNFGLHPKEEQSSFKMIVFGDPQPYSLQEVDYFDRGIVSELEGVKDVAFGLSMGDLVGNNPDLFKPYIKAVKKIGTPWYNLMGNHDINFDVQADSLSDESFEAHFGPANYAFNYGKVHFIVLDNILYPNPRGGKGYWGGFRKDQLAFIKNDLKFVPKDYLIVLAFHIPISQNERTFRQEDLEQLFELLAEFPHTLSLSAHTHNQYQAFFTKAEGWKQEKPHHHYNVGTTSGNWYSGELDSKGVPASTMSDGTPKGYALINFTGNQYKVEYKVAGKEKDYQIEISIPKVVEKDKKTSAKVYANFFMGSANDKVLMRVDGGKWAKMQYVEDKDPYFLYLQNRWDYSEELLNGRRPGNANDSKHLWIANIPTKLAVGEHVIEVKATDIYGQTFIQKKSYKIVAR